MTKFLKNIRELLLNQISFYKRAFDKKICVKNLNFLILIFELRTNEGFPTFLSKLVVNSKRFEINYPMICRWKGNFKAVNLLETRRIYLIPFRNLVVLISIDPPYLAPPLSQ